MKKKNYYAPQMKVVEIPTADLICTSGNGNFNVSNNIEPGNEDDWGEILNW